MSSDAELLDGLRGGDEKAVDRLYREYRDKFFQFAGSRYNCGEEDAADCFQDAVIVVYKNARAGKLDEMTASVQTYLFAVGKHLVLKKFRRTKREVVTDFEDRPEPTHGMDLTIYRQIDDDHRRETLARGLAGLGEKCQQILHLFFYERYSIESIQLRMGFSSPGAVRVKKHRCQEQLRLLLGTKAQE